MKTPKYLFREIRELAELPQDVNAQPERHAKMLQEMCNDKKLLLEMARIRQKRLFGTLFYYHPTNGRLMAEFDFRAGVCAKYKFYEPPRNVRPDSANVCFLRSINNDNVNMRNK